MAHITSKDQNTRQLHRMIKAFVKATYEHHVIDAHDVTIALRSGWGIRIDWHDVGDVLSVLAERGTLEQAGFSKDRMACYRLPVS